MLRKNKPSVEFILIMLTLLGLIMGSAPAVPVSGQVATEETSILISLDVKQMDLQDVLRLIAEKANVNIIAGTEVTGAVTMRLKDVDLWQALRAVLESNGFTYKREDGIIRVIKLEMVTEERPVLETEIVILKYARAEEVKRVCEHLLSPSGTMQIDPQTNTLIITDGAQNIDKIRELVAKLDTEAPPRLERKQFQLAYIDTTQKEEKDLLKEALGNIVANQGSFFIDSLTNSVYVIASPSSLEKVAKYLQDADVPPRRIMIKAEFVEVRVTALEDLGIKWRYKSTYEGYPLGTTFRHEMELDDSEAAMSTLATGIGIIFGSAEEKFRGVIDLLISEGKARLLSSPNVVTLEGQEATIDVGDKYPYRVAEYVEGRWVESIDFVTIGATLVVTPHIRGKNKVLLDIHPEVSEITGGPPFTGAPPIIGTREAESQIMVEDGKTIVVGGLLRETEKETREGIPYLSKVPVVGSLFTYKEVESEKTDLVVFITPNILPEKLEGENIVEKRTPLKVQMERLYQRGLLYKKLGQLEYAEENFRELVAKSRMYGLSDYLKSAEQELTSIRKLREEGVKEKIEKEGELTEEQAEQLLVAETTRKAQIEKETNFLVGIGGWLYSEKDDPFLIYEGQFNLGENFKLFGGGGNSSDGTSYVSYLGARMGKKLYLGLGALKSDVLKKAELMITGGFSVGIDKIRLEGGYVYVPGEDNADGIKAIVGIVF